MLVTAVAVAACGGNSGGGGGGGGGGAIRDAAMGANDSASNGSSADAGRPVADQIVPIDMAGCDGIGPGTEDCHARLLWHPAACGGGPCKRLVVYWSGGEQSCADGNYDATIGHYADAGFVAACAQTFTTSDEAGRYPYADELDRMSHIIARLRQEAGGAWDGSELLIAGVSHGATAPVAAIASGRVFHEQPEVWTGRDRTAVVLFDGISNPAALEEWTATQSNCASWHSRFVGRYGDGAPLVHRCGNGACYCANPPHAADWARDTTVIGATSPPSPYECDDFTGDADTSILYRYVSCGGGSAPPCGMLGTIIPDDQQTAPAQALDGCPGVTVSYQDLPGCAHIVCGGWDSCGGADAVAWLQQNGF